MPLDPADNPLPPSRPGQHLNSPGKAITFKDFAMAIETGDVKLAGGFLGELLGLPEPKEQKAAACFAARLAANPGAFMEVMQVRGLIQQGQNNAAMMQLMECFGIDGMDAMQALENLRQMA